MPLDLRDCTFYGPALPEPFVKHDLETLLQKAQLLAKTTGAEGKALQAGWEVVRTKLRALGEQGGSLRVANHVLEPLRERLGYATLGREEPVRTREGEEDGGFLLATADGQARLRAWALDAGTDLDAPNRRGRAYRFSPSRVAQRVLLEKGERLGLLTDGLELRLLVSDPARPDSQICIHLDRASGWRGAREAPDSYRLVLALASPKGVAELPELTEAARLSQTKVTDKLREQARQAVEGFVQEVLDHPRNAAALAARGGGAGLAKTLWEEGLVLVYRLLFTFKLESSPDPARAFSFASTSLWRTTYSPGTALARHARKVLDEGADTGRLLEDGLRVLFRVFEQGLSSSELRISPLGGMLFGAGGLALLDGLAWGERAVATLLDRLLWTPGGGKVERQRVHYGTLDVEDLGRVYESLLELEPGIAAEPMCRLRRDKLEVVVPRARKPASADGEGKSGTVVEWVEDIEPGHFFLRVGLGRKSTGSYYTPHPFVRFLVQEALGPEVARRSPTEEPRPGELLKLKVLDPAMGSGHFLVEACRFLGEKLYEACRLCDELASKAEERAEGAKAAAERTRALERAAELRERVAALPDPNDEMLAYLPSRASEGGESGFSQSRALALCRRLVAVHCLYGVDKNPLAVELAKLSLWLESYSEGLPLTFLDHRLIYGNSITGPLFKNLLETPGKGESTAELLFIQCLVPRLEEALSEALGHVRDLEATIGKDVADLERKRGAKEKLDRALAPFKLLARAWSGGALLGAEQSDDRAYEELLEAVADRRDVEGLIAARPALARMVEAGEGAFAFDLELPEVFFPEGSTRGRQGFDAVVGNPPWDALQPLAKEFFAAFDLSIIDAPTRLERSSIEEQLLADPEVKLAYERYVGEFDQSKQLIGRCYAHVNREAGGRPSGAATDVWQVFAERGHQLVREGGSIGLVLPSAFHANQSATGIRDLYLCQAALQCCYSFENRNKLFEIDSRFKFAAVVARRSEQGTAEFPCAFYLHDLHWLFERNDVLRYSREFIEKTGGEYLSLLELKSAADADVAVKCFANGEMFGQVLTRQRIRLGEEIHMSKGAFRFTPSDDIIPQKKDSRDPEVARELREQGYLVLHEGKSFHQYDDRWEDRPRYLVEITKIADRAAWVQRARYYRLAFRSIASSTNERTTICTLLPPGSVFGNSAPCEREPWGRPISVILNLMALMNSYVFDWNVRQKSAANINLFILANCPVPELVHTAVVRALAHGALRLSANHYGYRALWEEQLGKAWREKDRLLFSWPALPDDDSRWAVRAAIDALVAEAYGLTRDQYRHVLSSFSHASYPDAPTRCLAAFDELKSLGAEAFAKKHDPYWDIPINEQLPRPVIDFPGYTDGTLAETPYPDLETSAEPLPLAAETSDTEPTTRRSRAGKGRSQAGGKPRKPRGRKKTPVRE